VRVCLLEAGPADSSVLIHCPAGLAVMAKTELNNWGFETTPQPGAEQPQRLPAARQGAGRLQLGQRHDLCARPAKPTTTTGPRRATPGWAWEDVLPYFKRAEHNERGADDWHGHWRPVERGRPACAQPFWPVFVEAGKQAGYPHNTDFNGATQEGVGLYQVTHKNGERHSAAKGYLTPHLSAPQPAGDHRRACHAHPVGRPRAVGVEYRQGSALKTRSLPGARCC
jgi:choline dehydrogenase-like flavoprotein